MPAYFWQAPLRLWDAMFERGLKVHLLATYFAIPLMIESASAPAPRTKAVMFPESYLGRAVAALAADLRLMRKSGKHSMPANWLANTDSPTATADACPRFSCVNHL